MPTHLLDTNILSAIIREPSSSLARHLIRLEPGAVCTSIVVAAELRYGAAKRGPARLARRVDELLDTLQVLPIQTPADEAYAQIRARLEQAGTLIGPNDLLIAAQCVVLGLTLVTANEREFARVAGLRVENWLG